jgi:hypothetical protein
MAEGKDGIWDGPTHRLTAVPLPRAGRMRPCGRVGRRLTEAGSLFNGSQGFSR